ncbi:MAG: hypothetical protein DDT30_00578 [Dehalococcoidia bacterium]|nr:hypothetical protein [Bacillota bacterium]MBT9142012.1 hypothetical protein [Bacillota bacterium]
MISVVCVYNNENILNNWLLKSLKNQTVEFELIKIDNTRNTFKSAAKALNYGGKKAKGKYIMFVHQDVDLSSNTFLEEVEKVLDELPNLGIAGVAGKKDEKGVMTVIKHGDPPKLAGEIYIDKPTEVQTLDECLVIIPKSVFSKLQFDEKCCDSWHLYTVDYCLSQARLGLSAYVIPMFVYHKFTGASNKSRFQTILSLGSLPDGYYQTLGKLLKKHKNHVNRVYTTTGDWSTSYPLILQRTGFLAKGGLKLLLRGSG